MVRRQLDGVDLYYSYFGLVERTSRSNDAPLATYSGRAHLLGVGLRFAWDPSPPPPRDAR